MVQLIQPSVMRIIISNSPFMWALNIALSYYVHQISGSWFNTKMSSYQYRKSHCGDKTAVRSSYLHNGISYTGKMTPFYWISPQIHYQCGSAELQIHIGWNFWFMHVFQWCFHVVNHGISTWWNKYKQMSQTQPNKSIQMYKIYVYPNGLVTTVRQAEDRNLFPWKTIKLNIITNCTIRMLACDKHIWE